MAADSSRPATPDGWHAAVLEASPDGVVVVDGDGVIVLVNGQIESLFGYGRDELTGHPIEVLLPERLAGPHRAHRDVFLAAPRRRPMGTGIDLVGRRRDGTEFPVDVSLSPLREGGRTQVVATVRDVTDRRRAEANAALLTFIVESSDDAVYSLDRHYRVTSWNRAAERLYGFGAGEILDRPVTLLLPEIAVDRELALFEQVLSGEHVEHREVEHRRKDGLAVPVSLTLSAVRDTAGRVIGLSSIAREVTEQRLAQAELAESEARLRELQALGQVGLWLWDWDSDTIQWTEELYRMHGQSPLEFEGTYGAFLGTIHPDDRIAVHDALDSARVVGKIECEYRVVRPSGETRWVHLTGDHALDLAGRAAGLRGICQDVTDRRDVEEALRGAFERERAAADQLRAADNLKDEFLATVSHELRTPLTSIIGFGSVLAERIAGQLGDDAAEFLRRIIRNAEEMRHMVERLLDFSRLEAGRVTVNPEAVELAGVVASTLELLTHALGEHRVDVDVPPGLHVRGDADALERILSNLLTNAAKFSPPGSTIRVTARTEGQSLRVTVADEGEGVPPEVREEIFGRFVQVSPQPSGKRGTGVGLAIVERYVSLLGGTVSVAGEAGRGAEFTFTVPVIARSRR